MAEQLPHIDLRDLTIWRGREIVHPHAAVLEQQLREALTRSTPTPGTLETLIGLCELRMVPELEGSARADAWRELLTHVRALDSSSLYVGAFKVRVDSIVDAATALDPEDRSLLARLLLDRTAAVAVTKRDLRVGVRAAQSLDPFVLAPTAIIDSLLRPCIRWGSDTRGSALIADSLIITLDALAGGSGRSVSEVDVWAFSAAISMIDESEYGEVQQHLARVTGTDRVLIERQLAPERARRWWTRSQRRLGAGRSLSMR